MGLATDETAVDGLFQEFVAEKNNYVSDVIRHPEQTEEIVSTMLKKPAWYRALFKPNRKSEKNYDTYEKYHRTEKCFGSREMMIENLSKVLAAQVSKSQKLPFNIKNARMMAKQIREICIFDKMKDDAIRDALRDGDAAKRLMHLTRESLYKVPGENISSLSRSMKQLHDNMVNADGHSIEYQRLSSSIKKLAEIENSTQGMTPDKRDREIMKRVVNVFQAAARYMDGKEKVRRTKEGQACFENALDAISELTKHIPGIEPRTRMVIDKINNVRTKSKIDWNDFTVKYGASHVRLAEKTNKNVQKDKPDRLSMGR